MKNVIIIFLDRELRLADNHLIDHAKHLDLPSKEVIFFFQYDFNQQRDNLQKALQNDCALPRERFVVESLIDIRKDIRQTLQNDIIVFTNHLVDYLKSFIKTEHQYHLIYTTGLRNNRIVEQTLPSFDNLSSYKLWGNTVIHIDDLKISHTKSLDMIFNDFKEKNIGCIIRPMSESADENDFPIVTDHDFPPQLHLQTHLNQIEAKLKLRNAKIGDVEYLLQDQVHFQGGEKRGLDRLNEYIQKEKGIENYQNTKVLLQGKNCSSKISPWLTIGSVSAKMMHIIIMKWASRDQERIQMAHLFLDHLFIRDYQIFQSMVHPEERAVAEYGIYDRPGQWNYDADHIIESFNSGNTGIPIVDACIRELIVSGYVTNRARQIIAGYLVWEMNVDWRVGLKLFQLHLIDFHLEQSALSWQNLLGFFVKRFSTMESTHFKLQQDHININCLSLQQSYKYDPNCSYISKWVQELSKMPHQYQHEPWNMIHKGKQYKKYLIEKYVLNQGQYKMILKNLERKREMMSGKLQLAADLTSRIDPEKEQYIKRMKQKEQDKKQDNLQDDPVIRVRSQE